MLDEQKNTVYYIHIRNRKGQGVKDMKNNFSIVLATKHKKVADVHKDTGLSKDSLTKFYYQRTIPSGRTLITLAEYLDCSIDELLGLKPYVVEV